MNKGEIKKRITELEHSISMLQKKKDKIIETLLRLELQHESNNITAETYEEIRQLYLGGIDSTDLVKYYESKIRRLKAKISSEKTKLHKINENASRKAIIVATTFFALLASSWILGSGLSGAVSASGAVPTNATVEVYFAIAPSDNLTDGITSPPVIIGTLNNNVTDNYINNLSNETALNINVSTDSNVNVDFCLQANTDLKNGTGQFIPIDNLKFANHTKNNLTLPALGDASSVEKTPSSIASSQSVSPGEADFYRFWLDIPSDTDPLFYNNTLTFTVVQEDNTCP